MRTRSCLGLLKFSVMVQQSPLNKYDIINRKRDELLLTLLSGAGIILKL